jgi:protein-disulfide isomerase
MTIQNLLIPISILLAGAMISFAIVVAFGDQSSSTETGPTIELSGFAAQGDPDAPVTIVEYSDFACPYCKRFHEQTKPIIAQEYINEGLVRFVRKDLIAVGGDKAAEAAHCAGEQNAYWDYVDTLLENQSADRGNWTDSSVHAGYAEELGLNADALVSCFENGTYSDRVAAATREARSNGGSGTPFFMINGTPLSGAQPISVFRQVIDAELAEVQ